MWLEFIEIVEYLQGKYLSNPLYEMKKSTARVDRIKKFLEINKLDDIAKIWSYSVFTFVNHYNSKKRFDVLPLNCIISKNAYKRWKDRSSQAEFMVQKIKMNKGIKNPIAENMYNFSEEYLDSVRSRYFNTPRGYIECSQYEGLLYDKKKCITCLFWYACRKETTIKVR